MVDWPNLFNEVWKHRDMSSSIFCLVVNITDWWWLTIQKMERGAGSKLNKTRLDDWTMKKMLKTMTIINDNAMIFPRLGTILTLGPLLSLRPRRQRSPPPQTSWTHSLEDEDEHNEVEIVMTTKSVGISCFWTRPNTPLFHRHTRLWWMAKFHTEAHTQGMLNIVFELSYVLFPT